ncbi:hypothetical protein [Rhodanobacter sp. DHB23]|uniref:hypothetical protein n=1 Tax=Rhodanobacter sp. DHB23 TaxID=2775923 RepID=UPI001780A126|nr:hypothetical protein [Rhodanobacter sp. DHB23]MBD8873499.1 hypothetical protein [Rhodanobacter sp. DHB23]
MKVSNRNQHRRTGVRTVMRAMLTPMILLNMAGTANAQVSSVISPLQAKGNEVSAQVQTSPEANASLAEAMQEWRHLMNLVTKKLIANGDGYISKNDIEKEFGVEINDVQHMPVSGRTDPTTGFKYISKEIYHLKSTNAMPYPMNFFVDTYTINNYAKKDNQQEVIESSGLHVEFIPPNFGHPGPINPCVPYDAITGELWRDGWVVVNSLTPNIYQMSKRGENGKYVANIFHQWNCVNSIAVTGDMYQ